MRVSYNELQQVCAKVFAVLGFPAGVDTDAAYIIAWLQLHQFPGAETLASQLPELLGRDPVPPDVESHTTDSTTLHAREQSSLLIVSDAVDLAWALANDSDSGLGQVTVKSCLTPLFAIPIAGRRGSSGAWVHLRWSTNGGEINVHVNHSGEACVYGDSTALNETEPRISELSVSCFREDPHTLIGKLNYESVNPILSTTDFDVRRRESLARGLAVDATAWSELSQLSKCSLVPATDASRERGAGAQISDND